MTDNYDWTASDEEGIPAAQYTVPNGWIEVPYIPNIEVDEGVATVKNPHYAIIAKSGRSGSDLSSIAAG